MTLREILSVLREIVIQLIVTSSGSKTAFTMMNSSDLREKRKVSRFQYWVSIRVIVAFSQ